MTEKETIWNKEYEENMNKDVLYILNQLEDASSGIIAKKNWLKSLKDRLSSNNEYDNNMLGAITYCIMKNRPLEKEHITWLEHNGITVWQI